MYNIIYEMSHQSRFDARYWMLGAGTLGQPRGMVRRGRREEGSGWGTRIYLWQINVDIWQNQYNIVKLNKKKQQQTIRICENNHYTCPSVSLRAESKQFWHRNNNFEYDCLNSMHMLNIHFAFLSHGSL